MEITPAIFIPTFERNLHFSQVIKSQLARVMLGYLTTETNKNGTIPLDPPPINQLKAEKPNLQMLKLMIASDNLAEGIGQVLDDIIRQTSLADRREIPLGIADFRRRFGDCSQFGKFTVATKT
jgi:hypothetical protein